MTIFDNYESTINGEPSVWRKNEWWSLRCNVTLDSNLCGTAPSIDICICCNQKFIYLFYLFYLNHYLSHWWLIMTIVAKINGNNFLTLEQLHTFFQTFIEKLEFETRIGLVDRNVFRDDCNILVWNWSNTMNILSVVWSLLSTGLVL